MAKLKVILMDDEGQELSQRDYGLEAKTPNLSGLERAIEELRPQVLGDLTHDLLALKQAEYKKNAVGEQRELSDQNQDDKRKF